jgi:hypothetical protein
MKYGSAAPKKDIVHARTYQQQPEETRLCKKKIIIRQLVVNLELKKIIMTLEGGFKQKKNGENGKTNKKMWMEIKCLVITKSRFAGVNETERRRFPFF